MDAFFTYGFLQRALLAGIFIAVACALLGVFLILRRDSMIGHGLAHITFAGVALGLFLKIIPLGMALVVAVVAALGIMKLKEKAGLYGDTAIAILSSVGLAVGIVLATLAQSFNVDLFSYLFGDILAIEPSEVWLSVALAAVVVFVVILHYHRFMYMTFDHEAAKASGIKVGQLDILLTMLTAVTVVLGMKVVGILLVSALVVIPAAAGLQLASNFKKAIIFSSLIAVGSVLLGLFLAYYFDFPASGTIVILSFLFFILFFLLKKVRRSP
ncbi:MAG: metal ABC transporter permease [Candidatus Aminicenantes bacterium]|jgi:zinc transport system permease protein